MKVVVEDAGLTWLLVVYLDNGEEVGRYGVEYDSPQLERKSFETMIRRCIDEAIDSIGE